MSFLRTLSIMAAGLLFAASAPHALAAQPPDERASQPSYTLDDAWDQLWLRIFDRSARLDPDGPMLQRFDGALYRRYHFDINVPDFPMSMAPQWAEQRHGARLWVQSLSELHLANRQQLRTEFDAWENGVIGLQYDGLQDRITERNLLRFHISQRDIAGRGLDATLRLHPKWDKTDIDVEGLLRYRIEDLGTLGLRIGALDAFTNAAFGLLEARDRELQEHVRQQELPLALAVNASSEPLHGVRAELYAGAVIPHTRRHWFPADESRDHLRHRQALLGAGLLEWGLPGLPVTVGTSTEAIRATMRWQYEAQSQADQSVRETTITHRTYVLAEPLDDWQLEASVERSMRPEQWRGSPVEPFQTRRDREWLMWIRAYWMPTSTVGADLQLLRMHRHTEGPPNLNLDGRFNRLVTRVMLQFGDHLWTSFGVGWTLDSATSIYDGGGLTLIYTP